MKYITVSLVPFSVAQLVAYLLIPVVPRSTLIFGANVSLSADSRRACCQLLAVKIRVNCLRRLAKEGCGSETDRTDIRGGPICNDVALITPPTHLLDLYTIYGMKYQVLSFEWCIKLILSSLHILLQTFEKGTLIYTVYICIRIEKKYLNKVRRVRTTF